MTDALMYAYFFILHNKLVAAYRCGQHASMCHADYISMHFNMSHAGEVMEEKGFCTGYFQIGKLLAQLHIFMVPSKLKL